MSIVPGLLWTAPELLTEPQVKPGRTQKGDVYSFAIIMYEIHGRAGPYGDTYMSPKGKGAGPYGDT